MLIFTPFALCFVILRGVFMRFPELTYWQDATVPVPCFLLFLCFRKATQEIFSELDETKTQTPIFPRRRTRTEREPEGARGQPHHEGARPSPWPRPHVVRPPWSPPDNAPSPIKSLPMENPKWIGEIFRRVPQCRRRRRQISGDRSLCSGTLPGRGSPPGAISIGLHRRLCRLHRLHHHLYQPCCLLWWGGSSSPPGLRALPVAMWFTSLSHDVIFMWSWALYLVELVDVIIQILCYSRALYL
jgi:hypothetical protein